MKNKDLRIPMNLQHFAEPTEPTTAEPTVTEPAPNVTTEPKTAEQTPNEDKLNGQTAQELLVKLAKTKMAQEKAASEAAEWKRKYNATLSDKEKIDFEAAERKAAEEEENAKIRRENKIFKLEKEYLGIMKYTASEAERMAVAEVDDDKETKIKIMAEVEARKQKEYEQELLKRPVQIGTEPNAEEDAFIRGFNSVTPRFKNAK
jgi:hypothetical protein